VANNGLTDIANETLKVLKELTRRVLHPASSDFETCIGTYFSLTVYNEPTIRP
jgi:hypothetical protein